MAKVDFTRDYYADLEVSPSCSNDDIKKQFHKLAFLYHPDRNRGKEVEYNPRFQAIQAANEVLGDPDERAKYDASRRRGTVNNTFARPAPPRRNNPYQATSNFPPPPRRTPNPRTTTEPPSTAKNASRGGAERYARWAGPPPPQRANQSGAQEAREKANAFSAWQAMNNAPKGGQPTPRFNHAPPFPPRRPPPSAPESPNAPSARPRNEEVPGNPPRRSGFDPKTPDGHERPVSGAPMYGAASRYDRENPSPMASGIPPGFSQQHAPSPPPRGPAPTAKKAERQSQYRTTSRDDVPFTEGAAKVKTPYPANVGEKTYVNPEKLQRANSYRDLPNRQRPVSELRPSHGYERRRSAGADKLEEQINGNNSTQRQQFSEKYRPTMYYSSSEESEEEEEEEAPPTAPWMNSSKNRTSSGTSQNSNTSNIPDGQPPQNRPIAQPKSRQRLNTNSKMNDSPLHSPEQPPPGHAFPGRSDTFARTSNPELRGNQSELDDANFSPTDTTAGASSGLPRTESHPNMFAFRGGVEPPLREPPMPEPARSLDESEQNYFSADRWKKDLQEENWAARWGANTSMSQTSPTKTGSNATSRSRGSGSRSNTSRNNTGKTPITPQPASVEEEESGDPTTFTGGPRAESPDSNNAMDIDTDSLEERKPSIVVDDTDVPEQQPRAVYGVPSRPEWRDGAANTIDASNRRPSLPSNFSSGPANGSPSNPLPQSRLSSQLSMDDFRHVPPFTKPPPSGLRDMNDIAEDLPFPSRPSAMNPFNTTDPQAELPRPPKPPLPPQHCNQNNWGLYLGHMYAYIAAWHAFNNQMTQHFQGRSKDLEVFEQNPASSAGVLPGWLGAVGETRDLKGWDTYVAGMKDDEKWRTHWNVACDKHAAAVEAHASLRERMQWNAEVL